MKKEGKSFKTKVRKAKILHVLPVLQPGARLGHEFEKTAKYAVETLSRFVFETLPMLVLFLGFISE